MTRALVGIAIAGVLAIGARASAQEEAAEGSPSIEEPESSTPTEESGSSDDASEGSTEAERPPLPDATLPPREREGEGEAAPEAGATEAPDEDATETERSTETEPAAGAAVATGRLRDGSLDPCATDLRSRPIGPLSVGELDGQLGVPYRACPRNEIALGGDALLVADTASFYGNIRASGRLRMSMLLDPNVEGFVSWEALRYQTVISSVSAAYLGLGYLSYGATARLHSAGGRVYSITGRMVLPTTTGLDQSSQPLAIDVGVTGAWQADANFRFHMWLVLLGSVAIGAGPADPRAGVRVGGGVDWRPYEWIAFVAELSGGFGYRDALDLLAAQAGARFALGTEVGLELGVSLPLLGVRALDSGALPLAATLMLNWRLR